MCSANYKRLWICIRGITQTQASWWNDQEPDVTLIFLKYFFLCENKKLNISS